MRREILTEEVASKRSTLLDGISYQMLFNLASEGNSYQSAANIDFNLKEVTAENKEGLFVDFNGKNISSMTVNGTQISEEKIKECWIENKIYLPLDLLKQNDKNNLTFFVDNEFNKDQYGFILGTDVDGSRFAYIQTVPYYAGRVVPLFDQPDLKAQFNLSVVHSKEHIGITTGNLIATVPIEEAPTDTWAGEQAKKCTLETAACLSTFETTPPLSSYLLNLVVGPMERIDYPIEKCYKEIPMSIYCRSTLLFTRIFVPFR